MFRRLHKKIARLPLLLAGLLLLAAPASASSALTGQEAGRVVTLIETLQPELGALAYDEEAADDWFERDTGAAGLITRAGFTQKSWKAALDATMRGYLANVPDAEIDALFAELRQRLAKSPKMSAEQKQAVNAFVDAEYADLQQLRREGRPYADTVRPYVDRLRKLLPARLDAGE